MEQVAPATPTLLSWAGLIVPVVVAAITGFFSYRIGASKEAGTTQAALHEGFRILIEDLQAERDRLSEQLKGVIDRGNVELNQDIQKRLDEIEAKIEHNRRNADHNFQIINEVIADQIEKAEARHRRPRIVPQKLGPPKKPG